MSRSLFQSHILPTDVQGDETIDDRLGRQRSPNHRLTPASQRRRLRSPAAIQQEEEEEYNPLDTRHDQPNQVGHTSVNDNNDNTNVDISPSRLSVFFTNLGIEANPGTIVEELEQMTATEQLAAVIGTISAVIKQFKDVAQIGGEPARGLDPIPVLGLSHEDQVRTHVYSEVFKEFIRRVGRECLTDETLEAYNTDQQERSLYRSVIIRLNTQPPAFKRAHLPPKYLQDDRVATAHVWAHVKTQLKHVRHKARNVLLTGMKPGNHGCMEGIPCLIELSRLLWRHLMNASTLSNEEIDALLHPRPLLRTRFAFMRLQTIHNYLELDSRNVSQWDQMDRHLLQLRGLPVNYTRSWQRLLCAKDGALFGEGHTLADLDPAELMCPTHAEVNARLATLGEAA
ncbi:hypothetical protein PCANC_03190 [Puccinia coronata f. sp. avenae]|uniref:Uncharacterized protein n=1 Tax=Puccinia coronata f. sp. avenae TaxID=200324 RepID=A0A2N5T870_9BASI|nr:hypothetical protein PCANC_03190 [Puccinia coronata f. sp. avenae]